MSWLHALQAGGEPLYHALAHGSTFVPVHVVLTVWQAEQLTAGASETVGEPSHAVAWRM